MITPLIYFHSHVIRRVIVRPPRTSSRRDEESAAKDVEGSRIAGCVACASYFEILRRPSRHSTLREAIDYAGGFGCLRMTPNLSRDDAVG
jgi:hypothetical protein